VGLASLILGALGIVIAVLPLFNNLAQMIAVVLGLAAVALALVGRKVSVDRGQASTLATAGLTTGIAALVLSLLVFATCQLLVVKGAEMPAGLLKRFDSARKAQQREQLRQGMKKVLEATRGAGTGAGAGKKVLEATRGADAGAGKGKGKGKGKGAGKGVGKGKGKGKARQKK